MTNKIKDYVQELRNRIVTCQDAIKIHNQHQKFANAELLQEKARTYKEVIAELTTFLNQEHGEAKVLQMNSGEVRANPYLGDNIPHGYNQDGGMV
jgi:uncharacterized damage-inducible protein DinB